MKKIKNILITGTLTVTLSFSPSIVGPLYAMAQDSAPISFEYPAVPGQIMIDQLIDGTIMQTISSDIYYQRFYEEIVSSGVLQHRFERFDPKGWIRGYVLTVDLRNPNVKTDLLYPGTLTQTKTVMNLVKEAGAIAGVNGDFFDIYGTKAPLGVTVNKGQLLKSAESWNQMIGITNDGLGMIAKMFLKGEVSNATNPGLSPLKLDGLNEVTPKKDKIVLYNPAWGSMSRNSFVKESKSYVELVVKNNVVTEILVNKLYTGVIDQGTNIILGRENGAASLIATFKVGDKVNIAYSSNPDAIHYRYALSGDVPIVENGKPVSHPSNPYTHPRTAVGFNHNGSKMYLVVVDGRQERSRGMTYDELGQFMASIGAHNAVNLDSGGSSEMVSRPAGNTSPIVVNNPSDGRERPVPNGIGIFSSAKPGPLAGFWLKPLQNKVFAGFTRTITALPYDNNFNPINFAEALTWTASNSSQGEFLEKGVFKSLSEGNAKVSVNYSGIQSSTEIKVISKPIELYPTQKLLQLNKTTKTFKVMGKNILGYEALIEPRDVKLKYDQAVMAVTSKPDGSLEVKPLTDNFAAVIEVSVGELKTYIGIANGNESKIVDKLGSLKNWSFVKYPEEVKGSLSVYPSEKRKQDIFNLDFDFTNTDAARGAYIKASPNTVVLPKETQRIGLWVQGSNGKGSMLRAIVNDSTGKSFTLDFAKVDWQDWKYVSAPIPAGAKAPVSIDRIYVVETDAAKKYKGRVYLSNLTAEVPKTATLPDVASKKDRVTENWDSLNYDDLRFAVVNNLRLSNSMDLTKSMEMNSILQDMQQENLDLVIFNGNLVDKDSIDNYWYSKFFIESSLNYMMPYYALPGKQEVNGTNSLDNFRNTYGDDYKSFDYKGTKFLLLNTSLGNLRISNSSQWQKLQYDLEAAKQDQSINGLVIVSQSPMNIKSTLQDSKFDNNEARLIEKLLTEFYEESNKKAAYISSGASQLTVNRKDGIIYIDTGLVEKPGFRIFGIQEQHNNNDLLKVKFTP